MVTVSVLSAVFAVFFSVTNSAVIPEQSDNSAEEPGYYWRDYTGTIPEDAFPGGTNSNGKTTYIGQVLHENLLIPARIDAESQKVYYEWGYQEFEATANVKIFCTKHPEELEWIQTGNRLINNITDKDFVIGGYEPGLTLLIGRKQIGNELVIGKVVFTNTQSTLNTTKDGKGIQHAEFEVLCHKSSIPNRKKKEGKNEKVSIIKLIDVRFGDTRTDTWPKQEDRPTWD